MKKPPKWVMPESEEQALARRVASLQQVAINRMADCLAESGPEKNASLVSKQAQCQLATAIEQMRKAETRLAELKKATKP